MTRTVTWKSPEWRALIRSGLWRTVGIVDKAGNVALLHRV